MLVDDNFSGNESTTQSLLKCYAKASLLVFCAQFSFRFNKISFYLV